MSKKESNPQPPPPTTEDHKEICIDVDCKGCGHDKTITEKGYANVELIDRLLHQKTVDYQDVLVKECKYCPFNYKNQTCTAGIGLNLIGEKRDKKNFPMLCLLKHKPVLIRR